MKSCKILSEQVMSTTMSRTPMPHIIGMSMPSLNQAQGETLAFPSHVLLMLSSEKYQLKLPPPQCSSIGNGYRDQLSLPPFPALYNKPILSHMGKRITMSFVAATSVSLHNQPDFSFSACLLCVQCTVPSYGHSLICIDHGNNLS